MIGIPRLIFCLGLASLAATGSAAESSVAGTLRAGAARIDITPAANTALPFAGYGNRILPAEGVHDPFMSALSSSTTGTARP